MDKLPFKEFKEALNKESFYKKMGKVSQVIGLTIEVEGIKAFVGELCEIILKDGESKVSAEVVGFKEDKVLLMALGNLEGVGPECVVVPKNKSLKVKVGDDLLGKTLDGLGNPINNEELLIDKKYRVHREPPNPLKRKRIDKVMSTGVKAIDGMLTCGEGQRVGIFAGSGVGKSTLLGMISRYSDSDVNVIALIGERGREVLDFIEKDLGDDGFKKSVVVCATSDQPALVRLKAAFVATAVAEYFRDQGKKVMLMMDSVTRFAMAQREVGLAIGEPPTTKGYTPSVFALLPKLLERSGTSEKGSITAFYTVLVDGDDMNEPIADAVRGILDGHIVLSRKLASQNHFPAIDVQESVSRLMKEIVSDKQYSMSGKMRDVLATYEKSEDLINVGAYVEGTNPKVDEAVNLIEPINNFLIQDTNDHLRFDETISKMEEILE
ncbi:MAG: flagellar protein export ATPase FliI [Firmicutes bacterium]|nr:flagellar protein export ATPase FliI [Bacillota bacterium]